MQWFNVILQGVLIGGLYAMFAAGLSLIFGLMRIAWIVVVGNQAIFQMQGQLDNSATALRLRLRDAGEPGVGHDTFSARIADAFGTTVYDSGPVVLSGGNLQVLKP